MAQMKEIKNEGQFDACIKEVLKGLQVCIERIKECDYIAEGMEKVFEMLLDAKVEADLCLSEDEFNKIHSGYYSNE